MDAPLLWPLWGAFLLDSLLGDPPWLPHPVRWLGPLARGMEKLWDKWLGRSRLSGGIAALSVLLIAGIPWLLFLRYMRDPFPWIYGALSLLTVYFSFALKDLALHGKRVHRSILMGDLPAARSHLSFMVSRETEGMEETRVIASTLESLSENFSDSVIAPLLFACLFGPAGAWVYRICNTLDALWGYRNERFVRFGWAAAKTDDLLNWLPARLSALLLASTACLIPGLKGIDAFRIWLRDAGHHKSPNGGHPEAAAAGALGARFGGPVVYHGELQENPPIGDGRPLLVFIPRLIRLNGVTAAVFLLLATAVRYLIKFL